MEAMSFRRRKVMKNPTIREFLIDYLFEKDVITRDNVSVKVNAVIYFRVIDPVKAIVEVENYSYAMSQLAQTTLRSVCGQAELDDLLSEVIFPLPIELFRPFLSLLEKEVTDKP